jgi:hypothetical protein
VPITTCAVQNGPNCAGGTQSQLLDNVQSLIDGLNYPAPGSLLTLPTVGLNPGCTTPAPSELSSLISASNSIVSSPGGSATISTEARGNALLSEQAYAEVDLTATIPLSAPASSVDVTIPWTTTGVNSTPNSGASYAVALVSVEPPLSHAPILCADGSRAIMTPFNRAGQIEVFPIGQDAPAESGTITAITFSCPDGSDLVSGLGITVSVVTGVYAAGGKTEAASVNFQMVGVTATVDS